MMRKVKKKFQVTMINNFVDPTGAGDTFAGAAMGYIAKKGECSYETLIRAMHYGSAAASITVEGFGTESIMKANIE